MGRNDDARHVGCSDVTYRRLLVIEDVYASVGSPNSDSLVSMRS